MDDRIKKALTSLLKEEIIVASWGFSDLTIYNESFKFNVSGFLYQGKVVVSLLEKNYLIQLNNGDSFVCSLINLVDMLDSKIEKTQNYDNSVIKWLDCQ